MEQFHRKCLRCNPNDSTETVFFMVPSEGKWPDVATLISVAFFFGYRMVAQGNDGKIRLYQGESPDKVPGYAFKKFPTGPFVAAEMMTSVVYEMWTNAVGGK